MNRSSNSKNAAPDKAGKAGKSLGAQSSTELPWSLRVRLLTIIGLSLVTLWSLVAVWMLIDVRRELRTALDDRLAASARMVAGLVMQMPRESMAVGKPMESTLNVVARDGLACEVSLLRGEVTVQPVARTTSSPGLADVQPGYSTRNFGGKLWRTYVLQEGGIRIATADRIDVREGLLRDIALTAGIPFAAALVGSLLLLWFGIGSGLRPIERVRAALALRGPSDTAPLPETQAPPELRPLVDTIGHLVGRMQEAMARERRFTDDAAHELRTPLTGIKTHLQVMRLAARKADGEPVAKQALADAERGVLRLQNTLDQLLLLARLEGSLQPAPRGRSFADVAAKLAVDDAQAGQPSKGRVRLVLPSRSIALAVPESLLVCALRNLLDNAMRFSTASSEVVLHVEMHENQTVAFCVCDEGPGLSEADCALATQRFWRRGAASQGSGLGLSIVSEIASRYAGSLQLRPRNPAGLQACLIFPKNSAHQTSADVAPTSKY